jgi:chemotaxis protein methyltransferase CheR
MLPFDEPAVAGVSMNREDYDRFRAFLENACGITLAENKQYLIESRLNPLLAEFRLASIGELVGKLDGRRTGLYGRVVDAMTTNETSWFRDGYPYEILKQNLLPEAFRGKNRSWRIWSAACSSGQEPYSIAMAIDEYLRVNPVLPAPNIQIVATDISPSMLKTAEAGVFDGLAMARGLSDERKRIYFMRQGDDWAIKNDLRRRVSFRELNLTQNFDALGKFDIVFCRNVLIYFSVDLKRNILDRIARVLQPRGYLVLGGSESISGYTEAFEMARFSDGILYRLKAAPSNS